VPSEVWAAGDLYEPYVGRWSRKVAAAFCGWLEPEPGRRWLDVGCGTGALTEAIANTVTPARLISVDPSWGFLQHARSRTADRSVSFSAGDALALPLSTGSFDYVVSGLVLNFVADPARALSEMRRVSEAGGTIAAYVWDYAERMQLMRYFWAPRYPWTPPPPTLTRADASRFASLTGWRPASTPRRSPTCAVKASRYARCLPTSTTIGRRFLVVKDRHRAMPCR
jgi:SAM-dependent methyltransferase